MHNDVPVNHLHAQLASQNPPGTEPLPSRLQGVNRASRPRGLLDSLHRSGAFGRVRRVGSR
eukprot:17729-Eustigmatos_ZCMA.PRE.1